MEGFTSSIHNFKPSYSFIDSDQYMELLDQFPIIQYDNNNNQNIITTSPSLMGLSIDNFFSQQLLPSYDHHQLLQSFQPLFQHEMKNNNAMVIIPERRPAVPMENTIIGKRKAMDVVSATSSNNSSSYHCISETDEKKSQSSGKGKKVKVSENGEVPKDVVHVRARRGQATDSHSIAERVRRGKINERLRCLQDIVPGCYKSMGMAVMLDEIINYVQSLQNQVEFLSMKLTEASRFHDFDSDSTNNLDDAFQVGNVLEGLKMQRAQEREEMIGGQHDSMSFGSFHPSLSSLPYHKT